MNISQLILEDSIFDLRPEIVFGQIHKRPKKGNAKIQFDKTEIKFIIELIDNGSDEKLKTKLKDLHYADIEIILELSTDQATYLVKLLGSDKTADALAEVDEFIREVS